MDIYVTQEAKTQIDSDFTCYIYAPAHEESCDLYSMTLGFLYSL